MARADESGCHDSIRQTMAFISVADWHGSTNAVSMTASAVGTAWGDCWSTRCPAEITAPDKGSIFAQPETI
jgi:hypothetical protein